MLMFYLCIFYLQVCHLYQFQHNHHLYYTILNMYQDNEPFFHFFGNNNFYEHYTISSSWRLINMFDYDGKSLEKADLYLYIYIFRRIHEDSSFWILRFECMNF